MTRYGEMGSPSKLRISSDLGYFTPRKSPCSLDCLDSQVEVTCLSFNPIISKLLLVGTGHGQLNLYTTGRGTEYLLHLFQLLIESIVDVPILTLPKAFRSSSAVLSCNWSSGRASVFFAHDSQGYIKYWDLTKDQYEPLGRAQIEKCEDEILLPTFISLLCSFQSQPLCAVDKQPI